MPRPIARAHEPPARVPQHGKRERREQQHDERAEGEDRAKGRHLSAFRAAAIAAFSAAICDSLPPWSGCTFLTACR